MFATERIKLRKLTSSDAGMYHAWRNDTEVMKSTSLELDQYTFEETETFISFLISQQNAKGFIIEDIRDNTSIGIISLIDIDYKNGNAECIIDIGNKDYWNKGIGTEAMNILLNYSFNELNLHRLSLRVFSFNDAAIKLYERLSFAKEGVIKEAIYRNGVYHDIIHMGLLNSEFKKRIA